LKKFNARLETWRVQGLLRRDMLAERSLDGLAATLSAAVTARRPCCRLLLGLRANHWPVACAARASSPQQCNDKAKAAFDVLVQTAFFKIIQ